MNVGMYSGTTLLPATENKKCSLNKEVIFHESISLIEYKWHDELIFKNLCHQGLVINEGRSLG